MALIDMVIADLAGDPKRVAVVGQSMGGHGAWLLGSSYPDRFCAVVPMCGYWDGRDGDDVPPELVAPLASKPIWAFHSEEDEALVPIEETDTVVKALEEAGNTAVKYTRYPLGVVPEAKIPGHYAFALAFAEAHDDGGLWSWLNAQAL